MSTPVSSEARDGARAPDAPRAAPRRRVRLPLPESTLLRNLLIVVLLGVAAWLVSLALDPFGNVRLASIAYYFTALAGLTVLTGLNGQISLGHGAFMAVGAYSTAILTQRSGLPLAAALAATAVITAVVGAAVGAVAARLRGPYLAGATLAFAVGLPGLADKYPDTFGGSNGINVNPPTPPSWLGQNFAVERWEAWIASLVALVALFFLLNLLRGGYGRRFRAVRDDEVAASLSGLNVARTQITAFIASAACAGLAGGSLVIVTQVAAPGAFDLSLSLALLTGIVLGGLGSLVGALWGAIVLVELPASWAHSIANAFNFNSNVENNLPLAIYGVVLIGLMIVAPEGIQGLLRRFAAWLPGRVRRDRAPAQHGNRQEESA